MKKLSVLLVLLGGLIVSAQAADTNPEPETADPNGRLKDYKAGQQARYVIWYDGTNWNVHMTSPKNDVHAFNATIEAVDGKFTAAQIVKVDNTPVAKKVGKKVLPPPMYTQTELIPSRAATRATASNSSARPDKGARWAFSSPPIRIRR